MPVNRRLFARFFAVSLGIWAFSAAPLVADQPLSAQEQGEQFDQSRLDSETVALFEVREVTIDRTARSSAAARRAALRDAQLASFETLLEKITQGSDRERLPPRDLALVQPLVTGIDVLEEASSSRRYIAKLNIRFSPGAVSDFLSRYRVPHVLSAGRALTILHVHRGIDGIERLWSLPPALAGARASLDLANRIRRYGFLPNSLSARAAMPTEQVFESPKDFLPKLLELADTGAAIIIRSEDTQAGAIAVAYWSSELTERKDLLIAPALPKNEPTDADLAGRGAEIGAKRGAERTGEGDGSGALETRYKDMYLAVLDNLDTDWRQQLLVDTGEGGTLAVSIDSRDPAQFREMLRTLQSVSLVRSVAVARIGLPLVDIKLDYAGRLDQLKLALRYAGLNLSEDGADTYRLGPNEP